MDWFSWLSKTTLEPSLIYEYGLAFARNELQAEDLAYFNHEFLQSMGVSVAKHRLEILKLVRKEIGGGPNSLSRLILAINRTKKSITNRFNKWVFPQDYAIKALPEPERYREQWRGGLSRKYRSEKELNVEKPVLRTRSIAKSGPIDARVQEKLMLTDRSLKLSGPLDRTVQERLVFTYRSPKLSGPLDGRSYERLMSNNRSPKLSGPLDKISVSPNVYSDIGTDKPGVCDDDHTLWATLFQDMKPT